MSDLDLDTTIDPTVEGSLAWHQTNHHRGEWNACWSGKCKRFMRAHGIELAAPHIDAGIRKYDFEKLANERDALLAEVERLKAQLPDGGEWIVEYGWRNSFGQLDWRSHDPEQRDDGDNVERRVWYGPVEPIEKPAQIDSELSGIRRSTPDPLEPPAPR